MHQSHAPWPRAATRGDQPEIGPPGFAPIVDVDGELEFWRAHYDERTLSSILPHARFSDVEPAIRVGIHAFLLAPAASFDTLAPRLSNTYRRVRGGSCLSWYLAEGPCAEAYARLQHAVLKPAKRPPAVRPQATAAARHAQHLRERATPVQRPTARDESLTGLPTQAPPDDATPPAQAAHGLSIAPMQPSPGPTSVPRGAAHAASRARRPRDAMSRVTVEVEGQRVLGPLDGPAIISDDVPAVGVTLAGRPLAARL